CPQKAGLREKLEPLLSQRIRQSRIRWADDVRSSAIATHKLVTKIRKIAWADGGIAIEVGVFSGGVWIINRDQVAIRVHPIGEIALALLERWNTDNRENRSAADRPSFVVEEEEWFVPA